MNRILFSFVLGLFTFVGNAWAVESNVRYGRDIRPILADRCFTCHGPDRNGQENELRLDLRERAVESAIVPGKSSESELIARILSDDTDLQMPPPDSGKKAISKEELELLKRWINDGAKYEKHWAYTIPKKPDVPTVKNLKWATSPIDRFILAKLEKNGVAPSEQADPRTLARRLHFDLIGLPPAYERVQKFESSKDPKAYEELVDELLASKHFGERMAIYWLDLVRYADTAGYHSDNFRPVDAYRDYVIQSFNQNKPFDEFTVEQLAGDLLPNATIEQKIASGYNRLLQTTEEGGAQAKEYMAIYMADRVRNVSEVWLATTMGCCQCHDHKYDPLTTEEFYSLGAFFADIKERPVGRQPPNLSLPTPEQTARIHSLNQQISAEESKDIPEQVFQQWLASMQKQLGDSTDHWKITKPESVSAEQGTTLSVQKDNSVLASGKNPDTESYVITLPVGESKMTAVRLEALTHPSLTRKSLSRANGNFVLTGVFASLVTADGVQPIEIASAKADYEQPGWPVQNTLDGNNSTGWAGNGHVESKDRTAMFVFKQPVAGNADTKLQLRLEHKSQHTKHNIGRFRVSFTELASPMLGTKTDLPANIIAAIKTDDEKRTKEQLKLLQTHFKAKAPEWDAQRKLIAKLKNEVTGIQKSIRQMLIAESTTPREVRILPRGNWLDDSGKVVLPQTPERFGKLANEESQRLTRLNLANWIVDRKNPLTARVFVNRVWRLMMGHGLTRSMEDFGFQGEWPTHPELLDWLAVDFVENGYNVKRLIKTIVMTNTYQQTANPTKQLLAVDPMNRLFARQTSYRFEAEVVRDNALFVSNLLVPEIGGPSVKPYQPAGYWQHLNFPARRWQHDTDKNQYRRGLYTYWCRSFLHPSMNAFDAPSREECTAKRPRSNTPLQALVLLNDPTYVESARKMGMSLIKENDDDAQKIERLFHLVLQRDPGPQEQTILIDILQQQRKRYETTPEDVKLIAKVGLAATPTELQNAELAAWTSLCRVVLNLHETITRN